MALSRGEVAAKILDGRLLTEKEFVEAKASGIYPAGSSYDSLVASFYIGKRRQGYICTKHEKPVNKEADGIRWRCGFGMHVSELRWGRLSYANLGFLVKTFGAGVLERIPRGGER